VRPLPRDRQALRPGRAGPVRLLRLPLALVLGLRAAPGDHAARPARRVRPGRGEADERQVLLDILADESLTWPEGQTLIGDKNYYGRDFEKALREAGLALIRPACKGEPEPAGRHYFKPLRQVIESVNQTLKGQLDLERHRGRTVDGVIVRILQRLLALTAAIWHNDVTGQLLRRRAAEG
jgi:hypothetical protein